MEASPALVGADQAHIGAELDLLLMKGGRRYGVEVMYQDAPTMTPSMRVVLADLALQHLTVV
jgi:hypothetical protein